MPVRGGVGSRPRTDRTEKPMRSIANRSLWKTGTDSSHHFRLYMGLELSYIAHGRRVYLSALNQTGALGGLAPWVDQGVISCRELIATERRFTRGFRTPSASGSRRRN